MLHRSAPGPVWPIGATVRHVDPGAGRPAGRSRTRPGERIGAGDEPCLGRSRVDPATDRVDHVGRERRSDRHPRTGDLVVPSGRSLVDLQPEEARGAIARTHEEQRRVIGRRRADDALIGAGRAEIEAALGPWHVVHARSKTFVWMASHVVAKSVGPLHAPQLESQPSPSSRLPSSQRSPRPGSTTPSPQVDVTATTRFWRPRSATVPFSSVQSALARRRSRNARAPRHDVQRAAIRVPCRIVWAVTVAAPHAGSITALVASSTIVSRVRSTRVPLARVRT